MNIPGGKAITIVLAVFVVAAAVRVGVIFYERRQPVQPRKSDASVAAYQMTADDYVVRRKTYAYDPKALRAELQGKPVWVSAGNQLTCYPMPGGTRFVDMTQEGDLLLPLEKLVVQDVMLHRAHQDGADQQVLAIVVREQAGTTCAVPIGAESEGNYHFIVNDVWFLDDPHEMYKHWPAEIWAAIGRREAISGMNELQAGFALGTSGRAGPGAIGNRTIRFDNAGKPVSVTFSENRAVQVAP